MAVSFQSQLRRSAYQKTNQITLTVANVSVLAMFFASIIFLPVVAMADGKAKTATNCDIQKGACTQPLEGRSISLDILPRPVKAMHDLTFRVRIDGGSADWALPHIRLNMPAMDMGKNKVPLKLNAQGIYEGQGVIVRCRSGRRTWKATVDFPDIGSVDFIFDVIYE